MPDTDTARYDFVDGLAELLSAAFRAGVTEDELRADFDACLSVIQDLENSNA